MDNSILYVFISSKMSYAGVRRKIARSLAKIEIKPYKLKAWIYEEDAYAATIPIRDIYLEGLRQSALYIGLFGQKYGEWAIDEFNCAVDWDIDRFLFKHEPEPERDGKLNQFFKDNLKEDYTDFGDEVELCQKVCDSARNWLAKYVSEASGESRAHLQPDLDSYLQPNPSLSLNKTQFEQAHASLIKLEHVLLISDEHTNRMRDVRTYAASKLVKRWRQSYKTSDKKVVWWKVGDAPPETAWEVLGVLFDTQMQYSVKAKAQSQMELRRLLRENGVELLVLDNVWDTQTANQVALAVPRSVVILATSHKKLSGFYTFRILGSPA